MKKKNQKRGLGIVTLITDFGLKDWYVGAMKGSILQVNPRCQIIDVTHQIAPQGIQEAAFVLKNCYSFYPAGTVHVVVVDPGVGTRRRAVVLRQGGHFFVGPDNGVFTFILNDFKETEGVEITRKKYFNFPLSATFHGRDLFAPVAGHLSLGLNPVRLGPPLHHFEKISWPKPQIRGNKIQGSILWVDAFGNLITNLSSLVYGPLMEDRPIRIQGKGWRIDRITHNYGEGLAGQPMALFGSTGFLELAVNQGCAREILGLAPGGPLRIDLL
jgi:hypothetical protein